MKRSRKVVSQRQKRLSNSLRISLSIILLFNNFLLIRILKFLNPFTQTSVLFILLPLSTSAISSKRGAYTSRNFRSNFLDGPFSMKCTKLFSLQSIPEHKPRKGSWSRCFLWEGSLGCHHFALKVWPSVFLCTGRLCCSHSFRTFTILGDVGRISGGSAVDVDTLTACFIAHCTRGVGGGSGWGEGCDRTFLWTHFSR